MFKELDDNLKAMGKEIAKLNSAVEHINTAKAAAQSAVNAANTTNEEFKAHLEKVTTAVDLILKPHQELIAATENLTKTIKAIDFPSRLGKQEKEIKLLKILLFVLCGLVLIGTVATILILKK